MGWGYREKTLTLWGFTEKLIFRGFYEKPIYWGGEGGGICLKGELGEFVDLRGDLVKKRNGVF